MTGKLTEKDITTILSSVECGYPYKFWWVSSPKENGFIIQAQWGREDINKSRKWYVSTFATKSEVVQTAFKIILTALEHELREQFLYKGVPVFGPHFDIDDLASRVVEHETRQAGALIADR